MSDPEHEPSERLVDFILAALDIGIETVRATNGGMHPFLMVPGSDKPAYTRFVGDSMDECIHLAQEAAEKLSSEVPAYAIATDGYLTHKKEKFDAMLVEAGERICPVGFVFAQRYRPAQGKSKFKKVGRPTLVKEVPSRFPTCPTAANRCLILFGHSTLTLEDASRALVDLGLTVTPQGESLAVQWSDGPVLFVHWAHGEAVQRESAWFGSGTPLAAELKKCDAHFEIRFDDLEEVLDDMNTLIEVQATLQELTEGFQFNLWNDHLSAPDE